MIQIPKDVEDVAGWVVAGIMGAAVGLRTVMTMWAKERAVATTADVTTQKAQAEIDVIALLRSQLEVLRISDEQRNAQVSTMQRLIDQQAADLRILNVLVQRLNIHVNRLERMLAQNNIAVPEPMVPLDASDLFDVNKLHKERHS